MVLLLDTEEVGGLLTPQRAVAAIENAFREWAADRTINWPRQRLHLRGAAEGYRTCLSVFVGGLPLRGYVGGMLRANAGATVPETEQKSGGALGRFGLGGQRVYVLYRADNAELVSIICRRAYARGSMFHTERKAPDWRTAATSAVGTSLMARPDAARLGVYGSGYQAMSHLYTFAVIRPLKQVRVYSPTPEHRRRFAETMSKELNVDVIPVDAPEKVVEEADIVLAATNTLRPIMEGSWLFPGVHVTSIRAADAETGLVRELDLETVRRADRIGVVSRLQHEQDQSTELTDAVKEGIVRWEDIIELPDLVSGKAVGRTSPQEATLFVNSGGQGIADMAIAAELYELARERGIGVEV